MATSLAQRKPAKLELLTRYSDIVVVIALVAVIGMMVIPMPTWALDMFLVLNIVGAVAILLVTLWWAGRRK